MQETRGGAARATTQTSEREVVRDAARVDVCAKAAYLSTIGALFSRWGDDYEAAYEAARATAADLAIAPATPVGAVRCRLENEVLTLGAPAAAVPVESLYKPWADGRERRRGVSAEFGAARHLLLGDSAQHMRALYRALELEVPMEFCAMPDHVTLMTEVVALCVDAGNHEAALALLSEHFDWLDAYEQTLLAHAAALSSAPPLGSYRRAGSRSGPWARAGGSSRGGRPRPIRVPSVKTEDFPRQGESRYAREGGFNALQSHQANLPEGYRRHRCAGCCGHLLGGRVAGRAGRGRRHGRGQDSGRIAVQRLLQQVRPDRHCSRRAVVDRRGHEGAPLFQGNALRSRSRRGSVGLFRRPADSAYEARRRRQLRPYQLG